MPPTRHQSLSGLAEAEAQCLPGSCAGHETAVSVVKVCAGESCARSNDSIFLSVWPWLVSILNSFQPTGENITYSAGMTPPYSSCMGVCCCACSIRTD